ncbi:phage tail protein [Mixta gaviniae]|uniref:phage tail protein n=1 Tax=Mixta gaviniae TaxID=665914 RepID=UPI002481CB33|nr:phage tail protein [Mixta gaviniae]
MKRIRRQTLPFQSMQRDAEYHWPSNSRIGKRGAFQFPGAGEEKITLSGELYPEITGGKLTLTAVRLMAGEGCAWPLLSGNDMIYAMYVINSISETGAEFFTDGSPRKITFNLALTRVDESLTAIYGDLNKQAGQLAGKGKGAATRVTSSLGF